MQYMYLGESQVHRQHLDTFLEVGEELGICGLRRRKADTAGGGDGGEVQEDEENIKKEGTKEVNVVEEHSHGQVSYKIPINNTLNKTFSVQNEPSKQTKTEPLSFMELVATPRKLTCDKCNIQFSSMNTLKSHPCNTPAKFECKTCPFKFQLESLLKMHMEEKHSGKPERVFKPRKRRFDAFANVKKTD